MGLLEDYGWDNFYKTEYKKLNTELKPARVILQHSTFYRLMKKEGEILGESSGKIEFFAELQENFPVVGDWVLVEIFKNDNKAIIHKILPRKTIFSRKKAGKKFTEQIISANTDIVFIVSALDNDFNIRRTERYLTVTNKTKMKPVLVFNKTDLKKSYVKIKSQVDRIANDIEKVYISVKQKKGFKDLYPLLTKGSTICFIGSSGVGKSSIINFLMGEDIIKTGEVREKDGKGMHVTSSRQMYLLPSGAIVIDTPGMRELGLWDDEDGLDNSFTDIKEIAKSCKFRNCSHTCEPDCAVQDALEKNILPESRYNSYIKLKKELEYIKRKQQKRLSGNPKKEWKDISKMRKKRKEEL